MMIDRTVRAAMLALCVAAGGLAAGGARAESMKECSLKYQAAKKNNTLNGADWKSFRAAQCGSTAPMAAADTGAPGKSAVPAAPAATTAAAPAATSPVATTTTATQAAPSGPGKSAAPAAPVASGSTVFPGAVNPKYASLTAGKARMKTCVDQYNANKSSGGNGGLKWIQKGGGYYSLCSKKLKGA